MAAARIIVVGGGIAGLAVARALSRAGFSPEIAERERMWGEAGTGVYLPGNAARALRALGLEHADAASSQTALFEHLPHARHPTAKVRGSWSRLRTGHLSPLARVAPFGCTTLHSLSGAMLRRHCVAARARAR